MLSNIKNVRTGVYGLLISGEKILMIKKSRGPYKGKYDLPGGKIEDGESLEEALKREFVEETGLQVEIGDFISSNESDEKYKNDKNEDRQIYLIGSFFFVESKSFDIKLDADGQDSLGAEFINIVDLNSKNTSNLAFRIIEKYAERRKS